MSIVNPQSGSEKIPATTGAAMQPQQEAAPVTPAGRYLMIAEAAYFRAEKHGFAVGDTAQDWLEAEQEIDRVLQQSAPDEGSAASAKQAFQQKLEAQLKQWDAKLDALKAKVLEAKSEIRADFQKQVVLLEDKRAVVQAKIRELRLRTEDAWDDLKGGAEKSWDELHKALDQMVSRFK